MTTWDPNQYLKFADHRLRPALDLLARIPDAPYKTVWDLGCGPGNVTKLLLDRWPSAVVRALDNSPAMLDKARTIAGIEWIEGDIVRWTANEPADLIFSNAALHWVDDHATVFPRLMQQLARGGVLAVQMPRNCEAPSHTLLYESAREGPWRERVETLLRPSPVQRPEVYYDLLAAHATHVDLWEVEYLHVLQGENAVLEWTKGTAVRPFLDAMPAEMHAAFLAAYAARLRQAYPRRVDGMTLFPFRRLFLVAIR